MNLSSLYTEVVKEHSIAPHNKYRLEYADIAVPGKNPTCGDEIRLELKLQGDQIAEAAFTGIGCAISQASVSIMTDLIRGKSIAQAGELSALFLKMARREQLSEEQLEQLEDAAALQNVSNMPARIKCATMPWHTLHAAVEEAQLLFTGSTGRR